MPIVMMFLVGVGSPDTVDSGYHKPNDTGPFLLCVGATVIFIALVYAAAAIANHRAAKRAERHKLEESDAKPARAG